MKRSMNGLGIVIVLSLSMVVAGTGCGGEDFVTDKGVYAITEWTFNDSGCDAEGPELVPLNELLYVRIHNSPSRYMEASLCASPGECNRQIRSSGTIHEFAWTLVPVGDGQWEGEMVDYRSVDQDTCVGNIAKVNAYEDAQGQLTLEIRHQAEVQFPKGDSDRIPGIADSGMEDVPSYKVCLAADAREACADASCELFEVITAVPTNVDHNGIRNLDGFEEAPQELN